MADITLLNLNMLYVRYFDTIEREIHLPLGPLYLTAALEAAGLEVDFRDYQLNDVEEPFSSDAIVDYLHDPAPIVGFSCMANLLPFTLLAMRRFKERYPDRVLVLGGVGPKSVEQLILERFDWVDVVVRGEAERIGPALVDALKRGLAHRGKSPSRTALAGATPSPEAADGGRAWIAEALAEVPGVSCRHEAGVRHNERPERIEDLDGMLRPAFHHIPLERYTGFGMITSRGCPYPCTFCSVAPIWDLRAMHRSPQSIVDEIRWLHEHAGAKLVLFQDEFFVSGRRRVLEFCDALARSGLDIKWKAFGRINLTDEQMMQAMADNGCVEIRFGIESGSDRVLELTKKGFTAGQTIDVVRTACEIFRRVDLFYVWGFPFETMEDFYQSLFQMISFRMMGARILPSLLCLLPQTEIYREHVDPAKLEFAPDLFPEYMITGHEVSRHAHIEIRPEHADVFEFIRDNREIFPGFFHLGLEDNIRPKLRVLQEHGFYPASEQELAEMESCGAHSPRLNESQREIATRAS